MSFQSISFRSMSFQSMKTCARPLAVAAVASLLIGAPGFAQKSGPFAKFHGNWYGNGEIHFASNPKEVIRCRGEFAAGEAGASSTLKLELKCANASAKFELQSNLIYNNGVITGTWTELTRGLNGNVTGKMVDDKITAVAEGQTFTAALELTSFGDKQHITIASPGSDISNVLIGLIRSGAKATQLSPQ